MGGATFPTTAPAVAARPLSHKPPNVETFAMNIARAFHHSLPESAVTPEAIFWNRRRFIRALALATTAATFPACGSKGNTSQAADAPLPARASDALYPASHDPRFQIDDR